MKISSFSYPSAEEDYLKNLQALYDSETRPLFKEDSWYKPHWTSLIEDILTFQTNLNLSDESLWLSAALLNEIVSACVLHIDKLNLVVTSCVIIAVKFEEDNTELHSQILAIAQRSFKSNLICQMENEILQHVKWKLHRALPIHFFKGYFQFFSTDDSMYITAKNFCELCLLQFEFLRYEPSRITASAILCTRRFLKITPEWTPSLKHYTTYSAEEIKDCVEHIWTNYQLLKNGKHE